MLQYTRALNNAFPNAPSRDQVGTKSGTKSPKCRQKLRYQKSQPLKISQLALFKVPQAGIEPARTFLSKGF